MYKLLLSLLFVSCTTVKYVETQCQTNCKVHKKPRIALVLGSGGARGMAHIGVLEVLEQQKLPIDLIVGTSAGSIIGSMYALNQDAKMLKDDLYSKKISDLMEYNPFNAGSLLFSASGFASGEKLETFLKSKLKNNSFAHTKIPFVAVATEIETGKIKNFSSGTMWPAVKASAAAIPYYPPVIINEKKYIDGAVISPVPVNTAKEYAPELIIAVNINETVTEKETNTTSDMMFRALNLAFNNLASKEQVQADIIIEPKLENIGLWDDSKNKELYEAGKEAALKAVEYIKYRLSLSN